MEIIVRRAPTSLVISSVPDVVGESRNNIYEFTLALNPTLMTIRISWF
jgi:hypothetical protein